MASVNRVTLIGILGRDPEVRRTDRGGPIVSFSLATSESWLDKASGERKERVEWHNISIYDEKIGEVATKYCKKGTRVYLEGTLRTRGYVDRDSVQQRITNVVLPKFRGVLQLLESRPPQPAQVSGETLTNDDIPF